jgi:hypothetical protein
MPFLTGMGGWAVKLFWQNAVGDRYGEQSRKFYLGTLTIVPVRDDISVATIKKVATVPIRNGM